VFYFGRRQLDGLALVGTGWHWLAPVGTELIAQWQNEAANLASSAVVPYLALPYPILCSFFVRFLIGLEFTNSENHTAGWQDASTHSLVTYEVK